jgi:hypothetical protein
LDGLHGGGAQFFWGGGPDLLDRCFDLAWVWKWDPKLALSLGFAELRLYEQQTARILDELRPPGS